MINASQYRLSTYPVSFFVIFDKKRISKKIKAKRIPDRIIEFDFESLSIKDLGFWLLSVIQCKKVSKFCIRRNMFLKEVKSPRFIRIYPILPVLSDL